MQSVILIENVEGLGKIGDIVKVREGYARNYLIPKKLAIHADEKNVRQLQHTKNIIEAKKKKMLKTAEEIKKALEETSITIKKKAGQDEKLFGSVTAGDIEKSLEKEGIKVFRKDIELEEPIKKLGIYNVKVRLSMGLSANLKVWVVQE